MNKNFFHSPFSIPNYFSLLLVFCLLFAVPPVSAATLKIEDITRIKGQETTKIRGYGIVSGLNASGDDPKSYGPTARAALRMLELSGLPRGTEKEMGSSRNIALVEVTATIPATGARDGDELDCTVSSFGNAKSLEGGVLSVATLIGPLPQSPEMAEPLAIAAGKIKIENPAAPNVGRIKRGCRLTADFINPYIKDGNMTLVLRPEFADARMAYYVAAAVNAFANRDDPTAADLFDSGASGSGDIAKAMNQSYVVVKFPKAYYGDPMKFVADLMAVEITVEQPIRPRVVINERVGTIAIEDAVEVKPTVVTHKNIVAEIRPPVPPGQQEINPQQFVDIDTETKYRQFMGEAVVNQKLKALQASLDAVRIPPQDMIEIIKILERQGAIIGDVIYDE